MSAFAAFLKLLQLLWPFLKEVVLRNKNVREIIVEHKYPATLFLLLVVMFMAVLFNAERSVKQRSDYDQVFQELLVLRVRHEELQATADHRQDLIDEQKARIAAILVRFDAKDEQIRNLTALINQMKSLSFSGAGRTSPALPRDERLDRLRQLRERDARKLSSPTNP